MLSATTLYFAILALSILVSGSLFLLSVRKHGLSVPLAAGIFIAGLVLAYFFAKGVYVALNYSALKANGAGKWFLLVPEQFSFVGGAIGFCLAPVLFRAKKRREIPAYLDQLAFPAGLLAALMRFDEIFLGELGLADLRDIGLQDMTDGDLFARFPFAVKDSWGVWYLAVCTIAALMILVIIGCMALRARKGRLLPEGLRFERFIFLVCAVRLFLELTRLDCLIFFFVHVDQLLAAVVMLILFIRAGYRVKQRSGRFPGWALVIYLISYVLNGIMQYAMDKPWHFQSLLTEGVYNWLAYNLSSFGTCVLLATTIVTVILYLCLCRKETKTAGEAPAA